MQRNSKLILGAFLAGLLACGAVVALLIDTFANVPDFKEMRREVPVKIRLANGQKSTRQVGPKAPGWTPLGQIAKPLLKAVVASEDTSFYSHKGVDFFELKAAIKKDFEKKRWARGASTLTQQVIKNVYLSSQKTLWRKFKEMLWAQEIEKVLSKAEILCFYVNMAEWAPGLYGIRAAASHYFGVAPSELTPRQSAFLAMLLPSPIRYHVYYERKKLTRFANGRVNQILKIMNSMGFLDESEYTQALNESIWGSSGADVPAVADSNPPPSEGDGLGSNRAGETSAPREAEDEEPPPVPESSDD